MTLQKVREGGGVFNVLRRQLPMVWPILVRAILGSQEPTKHCFEQMYIAIAKNCSP